MEAGTVLVLGKLKNLKAAAVFAVINELTAATEPWKGVKEYAVKALRKERAKEILGEEKAILVALEAIIHLEKSRRLIMIVVNFAFFFASTFAVSAKIFYIKPLPPSCNF